jgi:chromosome transmission fidelity protein 1
MSPITDAIRQIIPKELCDRVVSKKVGHLVSADNILLKLVPKSMNGTPFNFSFENRHDIKMIKDLGLLVANYGRAIPDGLVVFFTSFVYLEEVVKVWKAHGIYFTLNSIKPVRGKIHVCNSNNCL